MPSFSGVHVVFVRACDPVCMNNSHSIDYSQTVPFNPGLFITGDVWPLHLQGIFANWVRGVLQPRQIQGQWVARREEHSQQVEMWIKTQTWEISGSGNISLELWVSFEWQNKKTAPPWARRAAMIPGGGDVITRARFPCWT